MGGQMRLLPHRAASSEAVTWGPWWVEIEGTRRPLGRRLEEWDYATETVIECQVSLDVDRVVKGTRLGSDARLSVACLVDCPSTLRREVSTAVIPDLYGDEKVRTLRLPLPVGQFATSITLSRHLVLLDPGDSADEGAAQRTGSRLAQSERKKVALEGEGGRFPTEGVRFSEIGMGSSAWLLDLTYEHLDDAFMGSVRLSVNAEHPAGRIALASEAPSAELVQSVLRHDIVRQLLTRLAFDPTINISETRSFEEDSLGAATATICDMFLRRDLSTVLELARNDPVEFESLLQERLDFLNSVGE